MRGPSTAGEVAKPFVEPEPQPPTPTLTSNRAQARAVGHQALESAAGALNNHTAKGLGRRQLPRREPW